MSRNLRTGPETYQGGESLQPTLFMLAASGCADLLLPKRGLQSPLLSVRAERYGVGFGFAQQRVDEVFHAFFSFGSVNQLSTRSRLPM